ncbi:MAG: hypothetical protein ACJ780_02050 [Solirubrobacteraceae bacterium]
MRTALARARVQQSAGPAVDLVRRLSARNGPEAPLSRWIWNLRAGRMQKTLAATAAFSGLPLGLEMYLEHYKGSFGDIWMWSPIVTSPLVSAAGAAGMRSSTAARTVLPAVGAAYALNGLIGTYTHLRGVARKPGGFSEPTYNLVMGPPLLAPGSLILVGAIAMLAAIAQRER